jgi:hypothetical protein
MILQVLDHAPITIRIGGKRTRKQAIDENDEEIDELAEETTMAPAKKVRQTRKKRLAEPDAQIENVQPTREPTPTCSLPPLSPSPPMNTRGKGTKARRSKRGQWKFTNWCASIAIPAS